MSLEDKCLTPDQAILPEHLSFNSTKDNELDKMDVGGYAIINAHAMWVDDDGLCWLEGSYPMHIKQSEEYPSTERIGVIRFFEGYVVDMVTPKKPPKRIDKWTPDQILDKFGEIVPNPVIAIITNSEELDKVKQIYEQQFSISLDVILQENLQSHKPKKKTSTKKPKRY